MRSTLDLTWIIRSVICLVTDLLTHLVPMVGLALSRVLSLVLLFILLLRVLLPVTFIEVSDLVSIIHLPILRRGGGVILQILLCLIIGK